MRVGEFFRGSLEFPSVGRVAARGRAYAHFGKKDVGEFKQQVAPDSVDGRGISSAGGCCADRLPWRLGEGADDESNQYKFPGRKPDSGEVYLQQIGRASCRGRV